MFTHLEESVLILDTICSVATIFSHKMFLAKHKIVQVQYPSYSQDQDACECFYFQN